MSDTQHPHAAEIDEISGVETTGHEWDGLKELNNPLPRWWLYLLYATIVWGVIYMVMMPSLPFVGGDHTRGVMENSQRERALAAYEATLETRQAAASGLTEASVTEIIEDPALLEFALAAGSSAFGDNCAACHGSNALGNVGYPNLQDDDWLWGGDVEAIHETLRVGINAEHPETRFGQMLAFGDDGILDDEQILAVSTYVRSLSGLELANPELLETGAVVFEEQCVSCHMDGGIGMVEVGAPNLADAVWLYGSDLETLVETIQHGRAGVMPAWEERLTPETVKSLAVYVHSLGGGV